MFCDQVLESIEPIASGEMTPHAVIAAHIETCAGCRAALASAREIDRLLRARPAPQPPAQFTSGVLARVRRQRWRSEQRFDAVFNGILIVLALAFVVGLWALAGWSG